MNLTNKKTIFWLVWAMSLVLFLVPVSVERTEGIGLDKVYHSLIFALLMYLAQKAFIKNKVILLGVLSSYALSIELVQGLILPWRSFDVYDLLAGLVGLLVIFLIK